MAPAVGCPIADTDNPTPVNAAAARPIPTIAFPESLPVSARRDEIAHALREHPVVIVCGETGSGKTRTPRSPRLSRSAPWYSP